MNTAAAIASWGLDYVVLTSVDRDGIFQYSTGILELMRFLDLNSNYLFDFLLDFRFGRWWIQSFCRDGKGNQKAVSMHNTTVFSVAVFPIFTETLLLILCVFLVILKF